MKSAAKKKPPEDIVEVFSEEDVPQRSEAWFEIRRGVPTASKFSVIMAEGKDGEASKTREDYMHKLAGEILTGQVGETFRSEAMERGVAMEPEALDWYEQNFFVEIERVGFVRRTVHTPLGEPFTVGGSSDGRIPAKRKIIEVKTMRPDKLIKVTKRGAAGFPSEHHAQCQGNIWIDGAETCDLILFYRGWKSPPKFTIERADKFIDRLKDEVERFVYELNMLVKEIKSRGRGW
jgi:YqaJ-like recombinase protein